MIEMLDSAAEEAMGYVAFFCFWVGIFCFLFVVGMAAALALRAGWRWLTRRSWSNVIVAVERKAFRQ